MKEIKGEVKAAFEIKTFEQGNFSGYASTYNLDLQGDRIEPGAIAQSIKDRRGMVPILMNHSPEYHVGYATGLAEDGKGLRLEGQLSLGNSNADNVYALLKTAQALDYRYGMSIGYEAGDWAMDGDVRILKHINLWEVSLTPFPAQPRAFVDDVKTWRDMERYLREAEGLSRAAAKRTMASMLAFQQSSSGTPEDAKPNLLESLLDDVKSGRFFGREIHAK